MHRGAGEGCHSFMLRHLDMTYDQLDEMWIGIFRLRETETTIAAKTVFGNKLLDGYRAFFKGSEQFDEIISICQEGLEKELRLPLGGLGPVD